MSRFSQETLKKMSESAKKRIAERPWTLPDNTGSNNGLWKGDDVGYNAVHAWIRKEFGNPKVCEHCNGKNVKSDKYDWANISGKYTRDRKDYMRLCRSCHIRFDRYKSINPL